MAERAGIEALAVHFTAGVAAGALLLRLPADPAVLSTGLLLTLASLLVIVLKTEHGGLLFPAFLLLGAFCAFADAFPGADTATFLERRASAWAYRLRAYIDGIPFPSAGTAPLLKALLTGDRSELPPDTVRVFRESGGAHLLALSGLHIGILYLLLTRILWPLGNSPRARRIRYALIVLAAGLFTLLTGASPSIVRAFLFIFLNETARIACRPRDPLRVLSTALLIQLVFTPSAISSTGFQLSYLAMAGIFLLFPILEGWYPKGPRIDPVRKIWEAAALSISCQVFTGPLAWFRFHTFPTYFLLTNLFALPLTTLLMGSAVTTLVLRGIHCCPGFLVCTTDWLCQVLVWILQVISSM
ncbi:MAG: ComEC/Rec2 family competence protein [Bacteroidales bacterium]|nr:ComEC/Rec2 family competence protein [Bacteroidales bacterium]